MDSSLRSSLPTPRFVLCLYFFSFFCTPPRYEWETDFAICETLLLLTNHYCGETLSWLRHSDGGAR